MRLPHYNAGALKPKWRRREWGTRLIHLALLLSLPVWLPASFLWLAARDLWAERHDFVLLVRSLSSVALLPWTNKGPQPGEEDEWPPA